jgi:hypothetical protein
MTIHSSDQPSRFVSLASVVHFGMCLFFAAQAVALRRWEAVKGNKPEKLVTGSDDFTMYLWEPSVSKKPLLRMTGHQQLINQVWLSPRAHFPGVSLRPGIFLA